MRLKIVTGIDNRAEFVEEHCSELSQLLIESIDAHHVSRQCRKIRTAVIESCLDASLSFIKQFTVQLVQVSKAYNCLGKCMCWLEFSTRVVKSTGTCDGMQQAMIKLIEAQDSVLNLMIRRKRLPSNKVHNCVRPVIAAHPELVDLYMTYVTKSSPGSPGLVWMISRSMTSQYYDTKTIEENISRLLHVFVDKVLCGKTKAMPDEHELACFDNVLSSTSQTDFEKVFIPSAIKMAKRSPEISMAIANDAMARMSVDFSSCSSELLPLIIQQGKHGKDKVRDLAGDMMMVVAEKTKDSFILMTYADAVINSLLAKDSTKLKTPQERSSMASMLQAIPAGGAISNLPADNLLQILEDLCGIIETESMADTKASLIIALGTWLSVVDKAPPSLAKLAQNAMRGAESVRRAFLEIISTLCHSHTIIESSSICADDAIKFVIDGSQKAAVQWDALLSLSYLLEAAKTMDHVDEKMKEKGLWDVVKAEKTCQFLTLGFLSGLSVKNSKLAVQCAYRLVESSTRISRAQLQASCDALVAFSLHYDALVRKEALKSIKSVVQAEENCEVSFLFLSSFRSMCNGDKSLDFIADKSRESPLHKNTIHERYLYTLLAITPNRQAKIPSHMAVALCVLGNHPKVSSSRGHKSAWDAVFSACKSFNESVREDINGTLKIALGEDWGIESNEEVVSKSAITAFESLGKACGNTLYHPFMDIISKNLKVDAHDALTAKQLRIYSTSFGKVSNESDDGGLIPGELMEEILSDKTSIKPPIFPPSSKESMQFYVDTLHEVESSKGKKEDPAAAARKKQLALEAEVRLNVVILRDKLSRSLYTLGNFAHGAREITAENLLQISRPCMELLSSPLVGDSSALECLNKIIACIPGIIGRFHSILSACLHIINKEEAKKHADYDQIVRSPYIIRGAEILIQATGGTIPSDEEPPQRGKMPLPPHVYSFFFPVINAVLRYDSCSDTSAINILLSC